MYLKIIETNLKDLNECLDNDANACSSNAECTNNYGSYQCHCHDGFTGDGTNCYGLFEWLKLYWFAVLYTHPSILV